VINESTKYISVLEGRIVLSSIVITINTRQNELLFCLFFVCINIVLHISRHALFISSSFFLSYFCFCFERFLG